MRSAFLATIVILNISGFIDRTKAAGCEDVGIWILDGLVSCNKLVTPSMWGVHTKQEYHCLSDTFTECCATCKELGHVRPGTGTGNGGSNTQPTAAPPRTERPTETPAPTIKPVQPVDTCKDEQIWIADSSVDCKYLLRDSHWGVNQNAAWRCANDRNTKCCKTCKQIDTSGAVITAASTKAPSSGTTKTASNGGCVDKHIWVMDMDFDCSLLESPSQYGFHNRAEYYCTLHPVTDCCATCTKLGYVESTTTSTTTTTTTTTTQKPVTKKPVTSKYLPSFKNIVPLPLDKNITFRNI